MKNLTYPSTDEVKHFNVLVLSFIKVKKSDNYEIMSISKLQKVLENCESTEGDIYDKATILMKGLIQSHPFASGNRRTAFITTKSFLTENKHKLNVQDNESQARVMQGIREGYYTDNEITEWIKNGKIRQFRR